MNGRLNGAFERGRTLFAGFTAGQRAMLVVAVAGLLVAAFALTRFAAQPSWTPLFSNLSGADANAVVEQLKAQGVQYELTNGGSTVLVPQSQVYDLRVSLAGKNLPAGDSGGWSLLDQQGMTSTDFQQNIAYQRALEGELGKTLQAMTGVQTAIVHLAIPKKDVFSSQTDVPTASVLLALQPGTTLAQGQVRSVMHMVAGSVPGLKPSDVTVTDSAGTMLSTREDGTAGAAGAASETDEQTARFEDRMGTSLQQMLDKVLGPGHAVVRVNAQLDFDSTETTSQTYVSASGVPPLSEATSSETYTGAGGGAGGVLGGTFPTLTSNGASGNGGTYAKSDRTVDNPVGTVVTKAQAAPGSVKRLTVAVVLDAAKPGVNAATVQALVGNAVGLDPKRGDAVQVSSMPFDTTAAQTAAKQLKDAQAAATTAGYIEIGKKAGIGLAVLAALLVGMRRRKNAGPRVEAVASDLPAEGLVLTPELQQALASGGRLPALGAAPQDAASDEQSRIARDRMRTELSQFVDNQPDEIAQLVSGWLAQRKG
ncbi:MAG TPA: flagellar basal-body MS-ring/collar protein FliF [Kineosporiaceae bacterium]|nr:flagellar basal-body MS-ring/collar protein FliF [Kineosporiaceae bacterium]